MRGFIVLCLSAVALAAPQGYTYSQQQSSSSSTGLGGNFQTFAPVAATSLGSTSLGSSSLGSSSNFYTNQQHQQIQPQSLVFSHGSSSNNYIQQQQPQHQETIISKRFYLHSAPEENDEEYREKHITVGTPKKNYNVVFIKAPAKSSKKTAVKIIPAVNEEKTVIYVLSKKTDAADIHAEVQEQPSTTTKPEVFFIKYKTPQEAAHAQEQIQAQYDALGGSSQVSDEGIAPISSVIGSLGNNANSVEQHHGQQSGSNFAHVQQSGGNSNNAYLPPNFF